MGKKKNTVRTLPSGEKVVHSPDDTITLVPDNRLITLLAATAEVTLAAEAAQRAKLQKAVDDKRASLDAGDAVPHDKRPV